LINLNYDQIGHDYDGLHRFYGSLAALTAGFSWLSGPTRPAMLAMVIVQRRWIAYFRAGQRSRASGALRVRPPVGEPQEKKMNKRDLIDAISGRLGDKKSATEAVNAVLDTIQDAVAKGDKVAITGFGVFEKSERPARTARNPATGATIQVPKSSVPKFRPGADFKALVNGESK
jgi:DNA-binding protein HU-beta